MSTSGSLTLRILVALFVPNLAFLAIHYAARSLPVQPIRNRIAIAFQGGDLQADPRTLVALDRLRGVEPFGDANALRMAIHRGPSPWRDALAPRMLKPADGVARHPAAELHGDVFGDILFDPHSGYSHRYWHGAVAVTSFLISALPVPQARMVLETAGYFLFLLMPLVACRVSPRLVVVLGVISGFGVWFSGPPFYGQSYAYAPAFLWSQAAAPLVVAFGRTARSPAGVVPLGLVLGAVAAFLEPMSGAFVLAGSLAFLAHYFSLRESLPGPAAFRLAALLLAALLAGVFASVLFKQSVAALVFGFQDTFGTFGMELRWRMGLTGQEVTLPHVARTVWASSIYLTFGSVPLARFLSLATAAALATGSLMALLDLARHPRERLFDYLTLLAPVVLLPAWYVLLPSHTAIHAWITVRLLYLPLALSWVLLALSARAVIGKSS